VTSYNRNFPMRNDGQAATMNFIGSPEIVTALALAGRLSFNPLTDTLTGADGQSFRLEPPGAAPDVPPQGFALDRSAYVATPGDGGGAGPGQGEAHVDATFDVRLTPACDKGGVEHEAPDVVIDPGSERLQRMTPWPAWDGRDLVDLPILIKTLGKTTTDHISPAGPWLRFRGHLERFSDSMFMGALNAFTGERGRGRNVLTGECGQAIADVARQYRTRGLRWVVVGDHNYGEGSSREHAALSPRLLGGAAVIARSFARIHESNLKKQGLLALTFRDPEDYEQIREDDRLSLVGLGGLAAGVDVAAILRHADGSTAGLRLRHSYTAAQIAWFTRGSALNIFQR